MNQTLKEGLAPVLDSVPKAKPTHSESITVEVLDGGNILVTPIDQATIGSRLRSPNVLFLELRRKVKEITKDSSWTVRYASKVDKPLLPFLHSSDQLKILIDPMSPYRSPVEALSKDGMLTLVLLGSHVYYFKPKGEVWRAP